MSTARLTPSAARASCFTCFTIDSLCQDFEVLLAMRRIVTEPLALKAIGSELTLVERQIGIVRFCEQHKAKVTA